MLLSNSWNGKKNVFFCKNKNCLSVWLKNDRFWYRAWLIRINSVNNKIFIFSNSSVLKKKHICKNQQKWFVTEFTIISIVWYANSCKYQHWKYANNKKIITGDHRLFYFLENCWFYLIILIDHFVWCKKKLCKIIKCAIN